MIAIYEGEGAIWLEGPPGERISASSIIEGGLKEVSLFIMPGGRDRPYHAALKGAGNAQIRSFVENGGTYLGICAGAYYGCKKVEFDRDFPLEVCEERELAFFSGTAIGPAFGKGTFEYGSEKGARMAKIGTAGGTLEVYYNGGCFFEGDFTHVEILARYLDLPNHPPAIIECSIGKGKAILSGVHLELSGHSLCHRSENFSTDQVKMEMKDRLASIGAIVC
jgi:glutamine amidotransferase-like uncharacterized protein